MSEKQKYEEWVGSGDYYSPGEVYTDLDALRDWVINSFRRVAGLPPVMNGLTEEQRKQRPIRYTDTETGEQRIVSRSEGQKREAPAPVEPETHHP